MRLLKLGIYHPAYLRDFYARRPLLKTESYAVQHDALTKDRFGSSDFWTNALQNFGYETCDIIANADFLQKVWAKENDFKFEDEKKLFEIAAAQIKKFRPDILLIADYSTFTAEFIRNVRRECSSIKLILGWCGAPYENLSVMREWDIALSCVPELVAEFKDNGIESFHVNHAFDARVLEQIDLKSEPDIDFAFVGSILKQSRFHIERERLLIYLIENTNLQIWSDIKRKSNNSISIRGAVRFIAHAPKKLLKKLSNVHQNSPTKVENAIDENILRRAHAPVFGLEMFEKLRDSRVIFNQHIDISPVSASNMRLFETTGVGACLLTDWKKNLSELFAPDEEVLTYKSAEECAEKVKYILEHEPLRQQIAEAGQRRTLREHNFENRTARIDEIIRGFLS